MDDILSTFTLNKWHYMLFVAGTLAGSGIGILATKVHYKKKYELLADEEMSAYKENLRRMEYVRRDVKMTEDLFNREFSPEAWTPMTAEEAAEEKAAYEATLDELPYSSTVTLHGEKPSLADLLAVHESLDSVVEKETEEEITAKVVSGEYSVTKGKERMQYVSFDPDNKEGAGARLLRNIFDTVEPSEEDEEDDDTPDYDSLTVNQLTDIARERGISVSGLRKRNIVQTLIDYDDALASAGYVDGEHESESSMDDEDGPYVISYEAFASENLHYSKVMITYYAVDDTLCDDQEHVITDNDGVLGKHATDRFGLGSHDKNVVYVRNDDIACDYEVTRLNKSYSEDILGFSDHTPRIGRMRPEND